jgi:hypothetical protein
MHRRPYPARRLCFFPLIRIQNHDLYFNFSRSVRPLATLYLLSTIPSAEAVTLLLARIILWTFVSFVSNVVNVFTYLYAWGVPSHRASLVWIDVVQVLPGSSWCCSGWMFFQWRCWVLPEAFMVISGPYCLYLKRLSWRCLFADLYPYGILSR